ncbi:AMP-dependent synthetase/ligase [Leptospira sp. GIMC2001]|uniref:AMP-dependent synthetase/ligase n=1 Tax=Leptospira sp. GIMC2001 TaxID=1513297 RepID=UPI002349CC86|nr:long-chain fatty acid--CoA ligase [Leptospira sp. GIMC2001]WCL48141.1 long-chain fatty acid--CoA ligase [Leptospira sp. GIMC2001]
MYKSINEAILTSLAKNRDKKLYFTKDKSKNFQGETLGSVFLKAENLGIALIDLGLQPQEKVGIMADNRVEWAIADLSVLLNGATNVPRGSDSTPQEIQYILEHSECKFCFVEHEKLLESILKIADKTQVSKFIVLDPDFKGDPKNESVLTLKELLTHGEKLRDKHIAELHKRMHATKSDDLFTIIYTSGTTGMPKGVMLTHRNMLYNVEEVPPLVGLGAGDRALSILPVWHIFERALYYAIIERGSAIYYTNVRELRDDFQKVKPTFMASAPRLWENLYTGIKQKLEKASDVQQKVFEGAYELCKTWKDSVDYLSGNKLLQKEEDLLEKAKNTAFSLAASVNLFLPAQIADRIVFQKIRDVLGGQLKGTISGGGALPSHVDEFFNVVGVPVYEGYGMTESAPIISVRKVGRIIQGSVGFAPKGTEVKILDDKGNAVPTGKMGIIHVRGPQVMKGYYKNPEATSKTINNGWLNTGDLGFISFNGSISVRGRVKDTIVLLGGENIEPVPIENMLLENAMVNQVIIVGQDQKNLTALIWPEFSKLEENGFKLKEGENLNSNKELRAFFQTIIKKTISSENGFKSFEKVTDFRFLPKPMEVGDELTNLFKMKRNVIMDKYKDLINSMY